LPLSLWALCIATPQDFNKLTATLVRARTTYTVVAIFFFCCSCLLIYAGQEDTAALICILAFTLVGNGGSLPAMFALVTNIAILVFGVVRVTFFVVNSQLFFIGCGFVFVLIALSSTQYYQRRRYPRSIPILSLPLMY
jgi:hypothetical protein